MAITVLLSTLGFFETSESVERAVLRLHVIANSNSAEDQTLKLQVRDALLRQGSALFGSLSGKEAAAREIREQLPLLEETAKQVVFSAGYSYPVLAELTEDFFPTRTYGDVTLPAGQYEALRVVIGSGKGENWWCVMFPPLCVPAAQDTPTLEDALDPAALELVREDPKYELRFWIVEQWRAWQQKRAERNKAAP